MNPLNLITGLGWQIKAAFIAALVIGAFATGWTVQGWRIDANSNNQVKKDIAVVTKIDETIDGIISDSQDIQTKTRTVYRTIYKDIQNENENADNICFSPDALRLWNSAVAGADTHQQEPARATSQTDTASTRDVLENAAQNFEICNGNAIKHNALIDVVESLNDKMCVCGK